MFKRCAFGIIIRFNYKFSFEKFIYYAAFFLCIIHSIDKIEIYLCEYLNMCLKLSLK